LPEWEQFDGRGFSCRRGETASAISISREDFDKAGAEKHAKPGKGKALNRKAKLQSSELGLLRSGLRRAALAVLIPRRAALLAGTQNPGAQTIPFRQDAL
jgi:hypothetical protein